MKGVSDWRLRRRLLPCFGTARPRRQPVRGRGLWNGDSLIGNDDDDAIVEKKREIEKERKEMLQGGCFEMEQRKVCKRDQNE